MPSIDENSELELNEMKEKALSLYEKIIFKLKSLLEKAHNDEEYFVNILLSCSTYFIWKEFAKTINDYKSLFEYMSSFKTYLEDSESDYFDIESTFYQLKHCLQILNEIEESGRFDTALNKIKLTPNDNKNIFGKYAFAADRIETSKVPFEKNTKAEQQIYLALIQHFRGNPLNKKNANTIHKILLANQYNDIFNEPEHNAVYRGMGVTEKWISKLLDVNTSKMIVKKEFIFKPKQGASSWSISKTIAEKFALKNAKNKNTYSIILTAYTKKNKKQFISGPKGLYRVEPFVGYETEYEVIGLKDITVSSIEII